MPNVNFTSSSIAQQDRFAQTTVSYESRNMQSIPFYPDVDHKSKFRGILALTLVCSILIGAVLGLIFGFRDVIFAAAKTGPLSALFGGESKEEASVVIPKEEVVFSLVADAPIADSLNLWSSYINTFDRSYSFVYDGNAKAIAGWDSPIIQTNTTTPPAGLEVKYSYVNSANPNSNEFDVDVHGWPVNAGTYYVYPYAVKAGDNLKYPMPYYDGVIILTIAKATPTFPGIDHPVSGTVYSGNTFGFDVIEDLPYGLTSSNVKFEYQLLRADYDNFSAWQTVSQNNMPKDAGQYRVRVTLLETANTKKVVFDQPGYIAEFEIKRAPFPSIGDNAFKDVNVTFDGGVHSIEINTNKLPKNFPLELEKFIEEGKVVYNYDGVEASAEGNKAIHAGTYWVTASFDHYNYITGPSSTFGATLTIDKKDISSVINSYKNKVINLTYTGAAFPESYFYIANNELPDSIYVDYEFAKQNSGSNQYEYGLSAGNVINAGKYKLLVNFDYKNGAYDDYTFDRSIEKTFEVKKATLKVSDIILPKPSEIGGTYTGSYFSLNKSDISFNKNGLLDSDITELKQSIVINSSKARAVDAGTHTVYFNINATSNYEKLENIPVTIQIDKASFGSKLVLSAASQQFIKKDGKLHLPTYSYSFSDDYQPKGDVVVDFLLGGSITTGVDKLGNYKINLVISDDNHIDTFTIDYTVKFNPMTIVMGIILGIVLGVIIAFFIWQSYLYIDKKSYDDFKRIRARIQHERGGARGAIVCEGRVTIINFNSEQEHRDFPWIVEPRFGRLFLTHATLEFYDSSCHDKKKRIKNYRNFLVQLKEVTGVEIRGVFFRSKLIVFAKGGRYVFYVEPNTAYLWRRDILHFRDLAHLYPMENNVVDNDYPFNYALVKGAD